MHRRLLAPTLLAGFMVAMVSGCGSDKPSPTTDKPVNPSAKIQGTGEAKTTKMKPQSE